MKKVILESDIIKISKEGGNSITVDEGTIFTPSALDRIRSAGIKILNKSEEKNTEAHQTEIPGSLKVAIASDHTGYQLKKILRDYLQKMGVAVLDLGTDSEESCDYPDFAFAAAKKVILNEVNFGIIIDATGIPSAITANKVPGIRAATCYNEFSARSSREHNNANILVIGAKSIGEETAKSVLNVWLSAKFLEGRHQRRLDKITEIEQVFLKKP